MEKTVYETMSHDEVYVALENFQCPTTLVVVKLVALYAKAVDSGNDPYELMCTPPCPIEEIALEMMYAIERENNCED